MAVATGVVSVVSTSKALQWRREALRLNTHLSCEQITAARLRRHMDGGYTHMFGTELWSRAQQGDGRAQTVLTERMHRAVAEDLA